MLGRVAGLVENLAVEVIRLGALEGEASEMVEDRIILEGVAESFSVARRDGVGRTYRRIGRLCRIKVIFLGCRWFVGLLRLKQGLEESVGRSQTRLRKGALGSDTDIMRRLSRDIRGLRVVSRGVHDGQVRSLVSTVARALRRASVSHDHR